MQEDEEWSDISDDIAVLSLDGNGKIQEGTTASAEKELALLPNMPTLFSNELPPCGLLAQVAYENVVQRLRKLWLERAHQESANIPIPSLCRLILDDLKAEEEKTSAGKEAGTKNRTPWRREIVFQYELRWAKYFVREAETVEKRAKMTEKQLDKQDFMDKMFPIPKELKIYVNNKKNQKMVSDLWKDWHHKKRGTVEQESAGLGVGGARDDDAEPAADDAGNADERDEHRKHVEPTA